MSLYFALYTVKNNKNKKSVKFQGHMLNLWDFIQVYVFTTNHHLKQWPYFANCHIILQTALKFTGYGYAPVSYSATCILKIHC